MLDMKKWCLITFSLVLLLGCAPVLRQDLIQQGIREFALSDLIERPDLHKGRLFILGGIVASTKVTDQGSVIEAIYVPVNARGYLQGTGSSQGRFLAYLPKNRGLLDPLIYREEREITIAGEFREVRTGRLDETDYTYPVFEIIDIHLWQASYYYPGYPLYYSPYPYAYPYGGYYPYGWYDPWRRYPWPPYWW